MKLSNTNILIVLLLLSVFTVSSSYGRSSVSTISKHDSIPSMVGNNIIEQKQVEPSVFNSMPSNNIITDVVQTDSFVFDIAANVTGVSGTGDFQLPVYNGGIYDFTIDWGDGSSVQTVTAYSDGTASHTFPDTSLYTVTITGTLHGWNFNNAGIQNEIQKLYTIHSWGNITLGVGTSAFKGATHLNFASNIDTLNTSDITSFANAFNGVTSIGTTGNLNLWDVSHVTDCSYMFYGATKFNQDLSAWDTSSVTNMNYMLQGATSFNGDISTWNTSSVTTFNQMFQGTSSFNQPLNNWDVSHITFMGSLFDSSAYNQPLDQWNTSQVTDFSYMFYNTVFDQNIGSWDLSSATTMVTLFSSAKGLSRYNFDHTLIGWAAQNVSGLNPYFPSSTQYTNNSVASIAHDKLKNTLGWNIIDGGAFNDIVAPGISPPMTMTFESGVHYELSFSLNDSASDTYYILVDSVSVQTGTWAFIETITYDAYSLTGGVHNVTIVVNDTADNIASFSFDQTVEPAANPAITSSSNLRYEVGTSNNTISWNISDFSPASYVIYTNGTDIVTSGGNNWGVITVDVDGLQFGVYNYTMVATDLAGNTSTSTILVTVYETIVPTIDTPTDLNFTIGDTGNFINWTISDAHPATLSLYQNGSLLLNTTWSSGVYSFNVGDLAAGHYEFKLVIVDTSGNMASDTVLVTINAVITNSTQSTPSTSNTSPIDSGPNTGVAVAVVVVVLAAAGGTVFFIRRRKA